MSEITYIAYYFRANPLQPAVEILIAELSNAGFESFLETDAGLTAYIQKAQWNDAILNDIRILHSEAFNIEFSFEEIAQTNWNAEWEKNFDPIIVDNMCMVRAPFHERTGTVYDIVIEPKMSFGTGHHETTYLMIQHILKNDFKNKSVLDMGCGTGVLAILTALKGANPIDAIDIDHWCYRNSLENIERNGCEHISVYQGNIGMIAQKKYDVIIANINRNVLLRDITSYAISLNKNGSLFLSGFYSEDTAIIERECNDNMLKLKEKLEKNNWVALKFLN